MLRVLTVLTEVQSRRVDLVMGIIGGARVTGHLQSIKDQHFHSRKPSATYSP